MLLSGYGGFDGFDRTAYGRTATVKTTTFRRRVLWPRMFLTYLHCVLLRRVKNVSTGSSHLVMRCLFAMP